jgi:hypothetical protein
VRIPGLGALKFHLWTRQWDARDVRRGKARLPALRASIRELAPLRFDAEAVRSAPAVSFLTGEPFLYQTVFSAYSLLRRTARPFRLRIHDDGSLTPAGLDLLRHLFPGLVDYETPADTEQRIETLFPRHRFPALRSARDTCALLRKLLDVHGGARGWRLFLDSDTYFHRSPDRLLEFMAAADEACCMRDHWSNYGHPPEFLDRLCGHPVLRHVNSGLVGLRSDSIDWDQVEHWFAAMVAAGGKFVFFEQGVTAMLLSMRPCRILPPDDYVLGPSRAEVARPTAAFHHYAGDSKYRFLAFDVPRSLFHA